MRFLQVCSVLLLAASAFGQYNYDKPAPPATTPRGTYLPPKNEQQEQIAGEGLSPEGEHEPGMPFDFTYAVKDDVGNDFSHNAESDGDVVKGEYRTLLPDGRLQIVKYTADWKNGYNAEITYEGEAVYPDPKPTAARPPAPPPPQRTTKNPYLSESDNDSQGLTPSRPRPNTQPPRPQTQPPRPQTQPPRPQTQPPRPQTQPPRPQTQPPRPQTRPPPPPPRPQTTPAPPPGLYGAPSVPFGVRNNPKFGYSRK